MNQKTFSLATGLIFLLIAVLHVLRLAFKWEAVLNGWAVPMWVSSFRGPEAEQAKLESLVLIGDRIRAIREVKKLAHQP
jgi:hypothetical protein